MKEVFIGEGTKETVEQKTTRKNEERKSSKQGKKEEIGDDHIKK